MKSSIILLFLFILYIEYKYLLIDYIESLFFIVKILDIKKNLSRYQFIVCSFGFENIENKGRIKNFLTSLEMSNPKSTVTLGISTFTKVDPLLMKFDLNINIEPYLNETRITLLKKYKTPDLVLIFFQSVRYKFYKEYLESHSEAEYVIFCDDDTLILNNPFDLLMKNQNEVHFMYDVFPYSNHEDHNYGWLVSWMKLSNKIKKKCGMSILNISLNSSVINNQIPWNSGLMMGKREHLIKISNLITHSFFCSGLFNSSTEQGLLNYLVLSGDMNKLGIEFHGHTIHDGQFLSCPSLLSLNDFKRKIRSGEVYIIHHYQFLRSIYRKVFDAKFREKIDLQL